MKLTKCTRNRSHFYDSDKHSECPHCLRAAGRQSEAQMNADVDDDNTVVLSRGIVTAMEQSDTVSRIVEVQEVSVTEGGGSLLDAVNAAKRADPAEEVKTQAFYNLESAEPVVGWIVCVKGAYFGESFNLKTGQNMVGRSLKMDIPLARELSISRDRHAVIIYEPRKRKFYVHAGESTGLTYVNDDLVMMPVELKNYDRLQFGDSEFVFCSFCGDAFTWDDYV